MNNATEIEWDIDNEKVSISFKNEEPSPPNPYPDEPPGNLFQ